MADDAGALLVRTGLITDQALLAARKSCSQIGGTIGEQLVLAGAVADEALTEFYRARLLVPRVNPNTLARLTPNVVEAIPGELAIEFRAVPVSLDREGNLTVAMSDPSDRHAVDELGFFTGKYVVRAVATQMQVAWCLAHYYGHITDLGQRLLKPSASGAPAVAPAAPSAAGAPNASVPRVRGFTSRIEASRHKVLPPTAGEAVSEAPRPSNKILTPSSADIAKVEAAVSAPKPAPPPPPPPAAPVADAAAPIAQAPPTHSEPYAQVHVSLMQADEKTPARGLPKRRQQQEPDPPELFARAGEVEAHEPTRPSGTIDSEMPAVVIAFDDEPEPDRAPVVSTDDADGSGAVDTVTMQAVEEPVEEEEFDAAEWTARRLTADRMDTQPDPDLSAEPAVIHDVAHDTESAPILLVARRPGRDTVDDVDDEDSPFVLLDRKKPDAPEPEPTPSSSIADAIVRAAGKPRRTAKQTQIGMGLSATPRPSSQFAQSVVEPGPEPAPPPPPPAAAPPPPAPTEPVSSRRPWSAATPADGVPKVIEEQQSDASTRPHYAPAIAEAVDDGWGPPGTTIPPPFLGALPGTDDAWKGKIPIVEPDTDGDDEPAPELLVVAPAPPPSERPRPDPMQSARELERASTRLVELLRGLDTVQSRDSTIDALLAYLAESHDRVAFFAVKNGSLSPFLQRPPSAATPPQLSLDTPSTLQDVVGTRLPYRGTVPDEPTRRFTEAAFGVPPGEVLILPISVRDRVVAVLYGDGRHGHTFDEHFAIAGRAAGLALERIVQAKRAQTER